MAFKKIFLVLLSGAALFSGCQKKPKRPDPSATVMGGGSGGGYGSSLDPLDVSLLAPGTGLEGRGAGFDLNGQIRGVLEAVYFDFDKSSINPSERAKLQAAADYLRNNPGHRLLLEGHCDWRGTAEYNLGLGDRRASAARQYLGTLGISPDRLETLSKGSLEAVRNADRATAAMDRRVELVVIQ
ncbi:OmpA family protein [Cephaloticoccus primus]|uniref:OmpA family protein n=1 Tax=Cephaloticoccus primus TaxID=1548207 RepID=UPI0018D499A1|nr:OmpA family protein [Cephaloticoccus primus]